MGGDRFRPGGGKGRGGGVFRGARTLKNAGWEGGGDDSEKGAGDGGELMREHMVPIDYVSGSMDSFGWERVDLDSVRMGSKFDFHGLLSIEKLSGDKAEKMLRKLGHPTATGKKNKTNAGEQGEGDRDGADRGDTEDAKESHDKKSRGKVAPFLPGQKGAESGLTGEDKGEDIERNREPQKERAKKLKEGLKRHAEEGSGEEGRESAKAVKQRMVTKIVDGKVVKVAAEHAQEWSKTGEIGMKKSKNRKRKPKNKGGGAAVGEPAFDLMAGGHPYEEDEDAEANGGTDAADAAADDAAEYDDEYEYEGWGEGIMMRKCIVRALLEQGFEVPTPIQAAVLPVALGKRCDVFGAAQTGSGKTLAFALPIIQRILDSSSFNGSAEDRALAALVLSPTRELALQVKDHFERAARYTRISVVAVVGGLAVDKQRRLLARRPQVVVGTPGRLWEQMQLGDPFLTRLHMLLALVIDEADRMLEAGHFQDLENILRLLPAVDPKKRRKQADEAAPEREEGWGEAVESFARKERQERGHQERHYRRQTLVFSATLVQDQAWRRHRAGKDSKKERERVRREEREAAMSAEERRAQSVTKLMERLDLPEDPLVIDLSPAGKVSERITQHRLCCLAPDKELHIYHYLLKHLSAGGGRALIFVNAIGEARRLANLLVCLRVRAVLLHGGLQQRQRLKNLDVFKGDRSAVLVATDLAARGLDIPAVEVVIHYHVPKVPSVYVHRCGRTARGKVLEGRSLLVMSPQETSHYNKIADVIGAEIGVWESSGPFLSACEKRIVCAKKLEALQNKQGRSARDRQWMVREAEAMDLALESGEEASDSDSDGGGAARRAGTQESQRVRQLRAQLDSLLDAALLPMGASPRFVTAALAAGSAAGLPEMLRHGAVVGSQTHTQRGTRVHRKKGGGMGAASRNKKGKRKRK